MGSDELGSMPVGTNWVRFQSVGNQFSLSFNEKIFCSNLLFVRANRKVQIVMTWLGSNACSDELGSIPALSNDFSLSQMREKTFSSISYLSARNGKSKKTKICRREWTQVLSSCQLNVSEFQWLDLQVVGLLPGTCSQFKEMERERMSKRRKFFDLFSRNLCLLAFAFNHKTLRKRPAHWVRQVDFDEKDLSLTTVVNAISQASWLSESIKLAEALINALRCSKNA